MGKWPPLIEKPQIEYVKTERRENFTQHHVRIEVASGFLRPAILLVPDGPFPAVVVPYYEPETSAGLGKELRDFGYQLTKRGFVTLSIGGMNRYTCSLIASLNHNLAPRKASRDSIAIPCRAKYHKDQETRQENEKWKLFSINTKGVRNRFRQ